MKRHAAFLKNIAALIMLVALASLLLPFCKITTENVSITVSGMEVVKTGAGVGYEYLSQGQVDDDYVLWNKLTWGTMRGSITSTMNQNELQKGIVCGAIASLPILFCFLAMIFTFMARGKKTMILPTLLLTLALLENIVLILVFFKLRQMLLPSIDVTLLIGMYAFTILSGVALTILVLLWITGGFAKPRDRRRRLRDSDGSDDEEEDENRRERSYNRDKSGRNRSRDRKKKKKNRKSKKRKKNKDDKENRKKKDRRQNTDNTNNRENSGDDRQSNKTNDRSDGRADNQSNSNKNEGAEEGVPRNAVGQITGLAGTYQGAKLELATLHNNRYTIGTTPEVANAIMNGTMRDLDKLARYNCTIEYHPDAKQYTITSHSITKIYLNPGSVSQALIKLNEGDSRVVGSNTLLYIGDENSCLRLD